MFGRQRWLNTSSWPMLRFWLTTDKRWTSSILWNSMKLAAQSGTLIWSRGASCTGREISMWRNNLPWLKLGILESNFTLITIQSSVAQVIWKELMFFNISPTHLRRWRNTSGKSSFSSLLIKNKPCTRSKQIGRTSQIKIRRFKLCVRTSSRPIERWRERSILIRLPMMSCKSNSLQNLCRAHSEPWELTRTSMLCPWTTACLIQIYEK